MKIFGMLIFCLLLVANSSVYSAESKPFKSVQEVFVALSEYDLASIKQQTTADFHILEVGEVWDLQVIENIFNSTEKPLIRRNFFSVIREENHGEIAWISYWNRAEITSDEGISEMAWLESVVLIKQDNTWKLQMLHSTRIDLDKLPENIEFQEYINAN